MIEEIRGPDTFALFLPEIKELLKNKDFVQLKELLKSIHSMDLASDFDELGHQEKILIFRLLDSEQAIEVFENLKFDEQSYLLNNLANEEISGILNEMAPDERADLFEDLPEKVVRKFFALMKKEEVDDVKRLLTYEEGTAGGLMTTEFVKLRKDMTAREAILKLQEEQRTGEVENVYSVYVTDENNKLLGGLSLQTLVMALPHILIRNIISNMELIKVNVHMDEEEVAKHFTKYNLLDVPVVDDDSTLLGIITIDDVVDIIHKEATTDIYEMGKISGAESVAEIDYGRASIFTLVKKRVIWLFILLIIGTFVSGRLLKGYSSILEAGIVLACFIPMLMDTGGNTGQQSLCLIVRGLATGDVAPNHLWSIMRKEIGVGLIMGVIMGLVGMGCVFILQGFNLKLGITVGISLMSVITVAALTGALLPLCFKRLGFDPAVAASPFITTIIDATCLLIYFEIARRLIL